MEHHVVLGIGEARAIERAVELEVLERLVPESGDELLGFLEVAREYVAASQIERSALVVVRHVIGRDFLLGLGEHLCSLVFLALLEQVEHEHREQAAVGVAHAEHGLVEVEGLLGVEVTSTGLVGGERRDAVGESFLHEVVAQVHIVLRAYGECHVDGALPVGIGNDFEHHEVALVERALALERDDHLVGDRVAGHHHTTAAHGLFVDGDIDRIGGDDVEVLRGGAYPVVEDILQFEGIVAKLLASLLGVCLIEFLHLLFERRIDLYVLISTSTVLQTAPSDGYGRRVVGRTAHLVDVPVGLQVREVADAGVRAHTLGILVVPEWEGVVIAIGEDDGVTLLLKSHQVVLSEVAAGIAA